MKPIACVDETSLAAPVHTRSDMTEYDLLPSPASAATRYYRTAVTRLGACWTTQPTGGCMDIETAPLRQATNVRDGRACRLCGHGLKHTFVDLGVSPLCESFLAPNEIDQMEPYFPLHAYVCDQCYLVQLNEYASREAIFQEYAYFSSYSTSWVAHAQAYVRMITDRLALGPQSLVVELASNDGYLLQHFVNLNIPALGIEPAENVAKVAIERKIATRVDFFGCRLAETMTSEGIRADLIVGNNVLAQVPDLNDFVAGMQHLLKPEGVITLEFPHLMRLITESQFDTIYHEHFSYFSLTTLDTLARRHSLRLIDVEQLPTHGGSLRVYLVRAESQRTSSNAVEALLEEEKQFGISDIDTYGSFTSQVRMVKRKLLAFLIEAKNAGKTICGYGAPGKGNTLLNYCGIGTDFLDFTVDRNPYKHGRFTPGMRIPILPVEAIDAAKPDYILILPWNLTREIVGQMRHVGEWGCRFIVPIPEVAVLDVGQFT
jgi:SAM-dependent methyltransferase